MCYLLHPLTLLPQVLVLIIGEEHTIVAWYVLRSESWVEMRVGLSFLRDRLERLPPRSRADAHSALDELEEWWSDRCCDGAADVKKHPIVAIFHGSRIWRAPRKDTFHAINGVNKTGDEGVPEQKSQLGTGLFNALREIPDSELQPVVDYLKRKSSIDDLAARTKARTEYRHHGIIRNSRDVLDELVEHTMASLVLARIAHVQALLQACDRLHTRVDVHVLHAPSLWVA